MPSRRSHQSGIHSLFNLDVASILLALCLAAVADSFFMAPSRAFSVAHALTVSGWSSCDADGARYRNSPSQGICGGSKGSDERCVMAAAVGTGAVGDVDVLGTNKDVLNDKQAQMAATLLELGQV